MTEVASWLASIPRFRGRRADEFTIAPLAGLTNRTLLVGLDGARYVLRIPGAGTDRYIDRDREHHNAEIAAALGIAPPVLWRDAARGATLAPFIEGGRPLEAADLRDGATLERAVDLLRALHASALPFAGDLEPFGAVSGYLRIAGRRTPAQARRVEAVESLAARARDVVAAAPGGREAAPCHCDPVAQNFVAGTARLWLVDWEYSARADPMWDLAYLVREAGLDGAGRDRALERYWGRAPGADRLARFAAQAALVDLVGLAWCVAQISVRGPGAGFEAEFERRLRGLDEASAADRCGGSTVRG